ncbi:NADP-dependent oxidoreductase [Citricoccus muralis]|uniref:NADP-dependent oxidoreductase n=1 Tax=Citricoccus muralis TaxID=169134 RepID=A0ABY8H551_9MICC|nr:NADP-dependent oxidoreductase [Citricoccus muralis]WFP16141.1 NADP-dependent oxidoreductase [Citricoccus muralis]
MSENISTQVQLVSRPQGWPTQENFRTVQVTLDELAPGEVRVRNSYLSVDPYMRGRMSNAKSYVAPFGLEETMTGGAVGVVTESHDESLPVGTLVLHQLGWRDMAQAPASQFRAVPEIPGVEPSVYLGILGMTGLTAYVGLTTIAPVAEGDTVFVSGAAGAVGTAVGQIARLLGASRVIGSAGSAEKIALLTEKYGFDAALNYKDAPVREQLAELAPEGIDVFFDNVGGDHLEAALDVFNDGGRGALCGAISTYNSTETPSGPDNMVNMIKRSLRLRGFTVGHHLDQSAEFQERMAQWFSAGKITYDETVVEGIENSVDAFLDMMRGANTGKMVVRIPQG